MFVGVGRTEILNRLDGLWQKATPSLVTVRGRRRIGKSTLVSEFARRTADYFISIDGQAPGEGVNNKVQLRSFMEQLAMQTEVPDVAVKNWKTTVYVVEIKRRNSIGAEIADEIGDKAKTVGFRPGVSVRTALVYDGALAPSIRTEHMLDFVIPADRLFKMN